MYTNILLCVNAKLLPVNIYCHSFNFDYRQKVVFVSGNCLWIICAGLQRSC